MTVILEKADKAAAKKKNTNSFARDVIVTLFCGVGLFVVLLFFWNKPLGDAIGQSVVFIVLFVIATFCTHFLIPSAGRHVKKKRK